MSNTKINKDTIPQDFTLTLAAVDALPVLFFGASSLVISLLFGSRLFLLGAMLCLVGGAGKVLWKFIVVLRRKNIWWLFIQMRILMPAGFVLMLLSVFVNRDRVRMESIVAGLCAFPSCICFGLGILGMVLMILFAIKLDSSDVRSNWIEQLTNGIAQAAIFLGLLMLL